MKLGPAGSPELHGAPSSPDVSGHNTDSSASSNKKKKSILAVGRTLTEKAERPKRADVPKMNWLHALDKQPPPGPGEKPGTDGPLMFVMPKPPSRTHEAGPAEKPGQTSGAAHEATVDTPPDAAADGKEVTADTSETAGHDTAAESAGNTRAAAHEAVAAQRQALGHEAVGLDPTDAASQAEVAADAMLLQEIDHSIEAAPDDDMAAQAAAAERTVADRIGRQAEAESEPATDPEAAFETDGEDPTAPIMSSEAPPANPHPFESASAGLPPEMPPPPSGPPRPPIGPPPGPPGVPPHGPDDWYDRSRHHDSQPAESIPAMAAARSVATETISAAEAFHNEQVARRRGAAAGLVLGFLYGNHRGKKVGRRKAEKGFQPVRKKLEKHVDKLRATISGQESRIRALAREKLTPARPAEHVSARPAAERMGLVQPDSQPDLVVPRPPQNSEARPEAPVSLGHAEQRGQVRAEVVAETAIKAEAPSVRPEFAAALAAPLLTAGELYSRRGNQEESVRPDAEVYIHDRHFQDRQPDATPVVPFNKKAEQFTSQELKATAEKLQVQGVSLKEMHELGRIDDGGLRRVINEFLQGGDISRAVSREVKETELRYERDPKLRAAKLLGGTAGGVSGGVGGSDDTPVGGSVLGSDSPAAGGKADVAGNHSASATAGHQASRPQPDAGTLRAVRDQQVRIIAGTTVVVIVAVIILAVLFT